jgi:hypothetical protein
VLDGTQRAYEDVAGQEGFEVYETEGEGGFVEDLCKGVSCGWMREGQRRGRGQRGKAYLRSHFIRTEVYRFGY